MSGLPVGKCALAGGVLLGAMLVGATRVAVHAQGTATGNTPRTGELRIEGQSIKQLILEDRAGQHREFNQPGPAVTLPAGEHRLYELTLENGLRASPRPARAEDWIGVGEDRPATLKVGPPLRQIIRIQRQGRCMTLQYELVGQGGESYAVPRSSPPPAFVVYKGQRRVISGSFKPG